MFRSFQNFDKIILSQLITINLSQTFIFTIPIQINLNKFLEH